MIMTPEALRLRVPTAADCADTTGPGGRSDGAQRDTGSQGKALEHVALKVRVPRNGVKKAAYNQLIATAVKRQRDPQKVVGDR